MTEQEAIAELSEVLDLDRLNRMGPISFQIDLYMLARQSRPTIIVETGTRKGVATAVLLEACRRNYHGFLFSCDPIHVNQEVAAKAIKKAIGYEIDRNLWTFCGGTSEELFDNWDRDLDVDLFIHDSDHREKNMRMELAWAWDNVVPGGFIVCDDWKQKHSAFPDFIEEHGLIFREMGKTARVTFKPDPEME